MSRVECAACGRPVPDVAYVGAECERALAAELADTAKLWPELLVTIAGQARMGEAGPRARGHAPPQPHRPGLGDPADDQQWGIPIGLPFNYHASLVREDVQAEVTTWARLVWEEHGGQPPGDIPGVMRWLAAQLGWCRYQKWAGEMWDALELLRLIAPAVDRPRPRVDAGLCLAPTEAGPCRQRLSAVPSDAYVHCPVCRTTQSAVQRRETILAGAENVLGTAVEISQWLATQGEAVALGTIYSWASRHRLLRHGTDPITGQPRYRVGDVRRLATARRGSRSGVAA